MMISECRPGAGVCNECSQLANVLAHHIGTQVGKPTMLDIQPIHCLSKINLISLFIKQTLHLGQFPYEQRNFFLFIFLHGNTHCPLLPKGQKPFPFMEISK
jgi:hypothetical protein